MKCVLLLFAAVVSQAYGANILFLFPLPSPSHKTPIKVLGEALVKRGHSVTLVSPYTLKVKSENFTEIILSGIEEYKERSLKQMMSFNASSSQAMKLLFESEEIIRLTLNNAEVQNLLIAEKNFDLIVQPLTLCDALLGVGYHLKAPTIIFNTIGTIFNIDKITGNSHPHAYVPNVWSALTDEMTFFERLKNTLSAFIIDIIHALFLEPLQDKVMHEYFSDAPPLTTLKNNISLVLLNAHYTITETPRPYMPNMIPIGGFHVQPESLPQDLKMYIEEAKFGVILFSLGSNIQSADLPKDHLEVILQSFAIFPQKFLWKFEDETLEVPQNVLIRKWLPQSAILSHPNVIAFITHGGLFSVTEAVYHGVPLVGIPAFGDQHYNIANAVHNKYALKYDFTNLSKDSFTAVIREVLENPIYKENIALRSSILRNQPIPPLDLAVYWIEQVVKYNGVPHVQGAGAKLGWLQSYLIDVFLFIAALTISFAYLCYNVLKISIHYLCARPNYNQD